MARVFLTAPFDAPEFITIMDPNVVLAPASLSGFRNGIGPDGAPWLLEDPQSVARGMVGDLDQDALARLTHVAQVFGAPWRRIPLAEEMVLTFAAEEENRSGPVTSEAWSMLLAEAAVEILGYRGRLSMPDIAARRQMILARAWARVTAKDTAPTLLRSDQDAQEVLVERVDTTHEGFYLTKTYALRHPLLDGGMSAPLSREVFVGTDAALVLPYDPATDRVLLVEQFRMGPFGRGDPRPWVLEPVAGRVDHAESPETCARRECREEAHLTLDALELISSHYATPGCSTEFFHCYLGLCDLSMHETGKGATRGGLESENEDIALYVLDFADLDALMASGEINIGPLFAMLLWLERERPRLRAGA